MAKDKVIENIKISNYLDKNSILYINKQLHDLTNNQHYIYDYKYNIEIDHTIYINTKTNILYCYSNTFTYNSTIDYFYEIIIIINLYNINNIKIYIIQLSRSNNEFNKFIYYKDNDVSIYNKNVIVINRLNIRKNLYKYKQIFQKFYYIEKEITKHLYCHKYINISTMLIFKKIILDPDIIFFVLYYYKCYNIYIRLMFTSKNIKDILLYNYKYYIVAL